MNTTIRYLKRLSGLALAAVLLIAASSVTAAPTSLPNLGKNYEILGSATPRYNCIAWVLGHQDRWVWPGEQLPGFDRLFGQYGYRNSGGLNNRGGNTRLDFSRQPGMEKIVLYAKHLPDGSWAATHSARQLADGTWSSKLGQAQLIRHNSPQDVEGGVYGVPVAVYVRPQRR